MKKAKGVYEDAAKELDDQFLCDFYLRPQLFNMALDNNNRQFIEQLENMSNKDLLIQYKQFKANENKSK